MSGTTLVFAVDLEDVAPQALNRATAEPEEENLEKKWPLEESMYIRLFKGVFSGHLERFSHQVATHVSLKYRRDIDYFGA